MARFQQSQRGGGQPDPREALRRARDAVARERAERHEDHTADTGRDDDELEGVEQAMRERDRRSEG
jgi:hypothetical protein